MSYSVYKIFKRYKPLLFKDGDVIMYRRGKLWSYKDNSLREKITIGKADWRDITSFGVRLFRREPKYARWIDEHRFLIVYQRSLKSIDIKQNSIIEINTPRDGFSDPLNICTSHSNWVAVWGDYGNNKKRSQVNIYGLDTKGKTKVLASFPAGTIRHIHNIIPKNDSGFYILTGDNEENAGIYSADDCFQEIVPVKIGQQKYRAVIGFDTSDGLLYATDAVNEQNYVYLLQKNGDLRVICELNGSCIYGRKVSDGYLFSTTVEPDEKNRGFGSWLSNKRGKGILSDDVHIVKVFQEDFRTEMIMDFKKDNLPMKLMQYGSVQFPDGNGKLLWIYPVSVKHYGGSAVQIGE